MHEFGITSALLEAVEERAQELGARKVVAINLIAGERSGIVDDSLRFYFDMLAPGTACDGAQITVRRTPMRFHCQACDHDYTPHGADFRCAACGSVGHVTDDGSQVLIESIEIET